MALLDKVIWRSLDLRQSVALWRVRDDEFWVRGHFPGKPMLPGVLQIEAGAQLGVFMYNSRFPEPRVAAFTHITDVSYRTPVTPGDMFYLLCQELKCSGRRFTSHIQGVVISSDASGTPSLSTAKLTFEAMISGMSLG
jgi:3-hydroxyacyl-[acyl-carrier-protein] dehydratase